MIITRRQLRKLINESLKEMKLGVAEPNPPGQYWGEPKRRTDIVGKAMNIKKLANAINIMMKGKGNKNVDALVMKIMMLADEIETEAKK